MPSTSIMRFDTANVALLNRRTSTTGCSCRHSQSTNVTSATAATVAKITMVCELNQSSSCPLSSTYSSAPRPTAISPRPTPSMGPTRFFASTRCGGSTRMRDDSNIEAIPTGTLMKKTQRHE